MFTKNGMTPIIIAIFIVHAVSGKHRQWPSEREVVCHLVPITCRTEIAEVLWPAPEPSTCRKSCVMRLLIGQRTMTIVCRLCIGSLLSFKETIKVYVDESLFPVWVESELRSKEFETGMFQKTHSVHGISIRNLPKSTDLKNFRLNSLICSSPNDCERGGGGGG